MLKKKMFKNKNKGIVFKVRWFVRPDINTDMTIICDGRARVYIGPYKPSRFKNNTFILYRLIESKMLTTKLLHLLRWILYTDHPDKFLIQILNSFL